MFSLTRIIKSVVTGQVPVTLEWRNTPGKTQTKPKNDIRIVYIIAEAIIGSARRIGVEVLNSEIGSQPTMCQVHTQY